MVREGKRIWQVKREKEFLPLCPKGDRQKTNHRPPNATSLEKTVEIDAKAPTSINC
jgi:hypothetical protein